MSAKNAFTFTWKIENYSKITPNVNDYLDSDSFSTDFFGKNEWYLQFYSNRIENDIRHGVWCFLCRKAGNETSIVDYTFQLIDPRNEVFKSKSIEAITIEKCRGAFLTTFEDLRNETNTWDEDVLTIRCLLSIRELPEKSFHAYESKLKFGLNHNTYAWCIKEPDSFEWSSSKIFTFTNITSLEVILTAPSDDIVIQLRNKPIVTRGFLYVTCKVTLLDVFDVEQFSITDKYRFDNSDFSSLWHFPTSFSKKALEEKNCVQNGYFTLIIEFFVPNGIDSNKNKRRVKYDIIPEAKSFQDADAITALQNDLKELQLSKKHSDVSLQVDGELFCAHKNILCSRSPIFKAMFDCDMLENKTNVVNITDLDSKTLGNFLQFLYTGTFDYSDYENILKLIVAADKYQVESLMEMCAHFLMFSLTIKNVCDVILIADMVKHNVLKASAMKFIEKHAETILISEEWSDWVKQNIHLAFEITSTLALTVSRQSCKSFSAIKHLKENVYKM